MANEVAPFPEVEHETYGKNGDSNSRTQETSERPKEPNFIMKAARRFMPDGGILSGVFNLAGGSLGAGILALASAFNSSGIVAGTIYLIAIYLLTVFSMYLLAVTSLKTGIRSYEGMARQLFGRGGDIFTAVIMFVKCFGACVAYVISIGDVIEAFLNDDSVTGYWRTKSFVRVLNCIVFFLFMLPLSLPKRINSVRYVSFFAVSFIIYFVIVSIIHSAQNGLKHGLRDDLVLFRGGNEGIRGLGELMFAYLCQSNMFEVWNEMKPKSTASRMTLETAISMFLCTVLYWCTGFFGYADFGSSVTSSILKMFRPLRDAMMFVAYIGIVIKLCVAFSLHILPCRDSLHHLLGWKLDTVAWWKNALLCTVVCIIALIAGLFIPNVNIVLGLLGSLTGGFIAFVFPALFFIYSGGFTYAKTGFLLYTSTYLLLLTGVVVICFGTSSTIYGIVK
ncbi:amino acid permease, putative [Trypanosoma cruzi marinkellei]|uniref:Amino acid permease, putative n=1 Tax=Trypanosoma cruzi marinkellei TaxID=85056 RepID=K2MP15_TRYCR|nr:amino acid permease, putative [Trypanosoma cruzi marinkellei]